MSDAPNTFLSLTLARGALARPRSPYSSVPARTLVIDAARQTLAVLEHGEQVASFPVSTAARGLGGEAGSHRTPPGWHRIHAKIGAGAPSGMVFDSRVATGRVWNGEASDDDLILTRILTLEGLEEGVNRGPGVDSLERYIYIHGTNHPEGVGRPGSHGCIRMRDQDLLALFDRVREGDAVVIVEGAPAEWPDPRSGGRFHYAGVAGSGMSALAQFQAMMGGTASGSDRAFDKGERADDRSKLERLGIAIHSQDGAGVGPGCAALVVSTAVEEQVPDVAAARAAGVPVVHRSEMLAHWVRSFRTIAVAGTSGKSTVVAMIFEILRGAGRDPSVITGGGLRLLERQGLWGNAWFGGSDLLVVEADESDGSLVRYEPAIGVLLNLQRDHHEIATVAGMFDTFRARVREAAVVGEDDNLRTYAAGASVFGFGPLADVRAESVELGAEGSRFEVDGTPFQLPCPGRHNVANAIAAIAACREVGVALADMVAPLAGFHGVDRRFQTVGVQGAIEVVDDFAHNPAKIEAAIATAHTRVMARAGAGRVLAIYQPHGFGPTRFLRADLVEAFAKALGPHDRLWMLEVFYAGGTATRDFSAADIVAEIAARGVAAEFAAGRDALADRVIAEARPGDLVLVMGARDPSLTALARRMVERLAAVGGAAPARPA